jgi:hypothetical protein
MQADLGCSLYTVSNSGTLSRMLSDGGSPIDTDPRGSPPIWRISSVMLSTLLRISRPRFASAMPASVIWIPRAPRIASLLSSSSSSFEMFSEREGCAMFNALAAAEIEPCSAKAMN